MLDGLTPSSDMRCQVDDLFNPGLITILARGPGIVYIGDNGVGRQLTDPYAVCPDPIGVLSGIVRDGWLPDTASQTAAFEIHGTDVSTDKMQQVGTVKLTATPPGLLRMLGNILVARGIDQLSIGHPDAPPIDLRQLAYPAFARDTHSAIPLSYVRPEVLHQNRRIDIAFHQSPDDEALDWAHQIIDRWSRLCALGTFAPLDRPPSGSGVFLDRVDLTKAETLTVEIDDYFLVDEAALVPLACALTGPAGVEAAVKEIRVE